MSDYLTDPAYSTLSCNIWHDTDTLFDCGNNHWLHDHEKYNTKQGSGILKLLKESGPAYETYKPELHTKPMSLLGKFFVFCMVAIVFPALIVGIMTITEVVNENKSLNQTLAGKTFSEIFAKE